MTAAAKNYGRCICGTFTSRRDSSGLWRCVPCTISAVNIHASDTAATTRDAKQDFENYIRQQVAADPTYAERLLADMRNAGAYTAGFRMRIFGKE